LLGTIVYALRLQAFFVALPLFLDQRGFSAGEIGFITAGNWAAEVIFGIPVTMLGARGRARELLALGPFLASFGLAALVLMPSDSVGISFLWSVVAGFGGATYWILGDPLLASTSAPHLRPRLFALKFCMLTAAMSLGGGIGGWVPGGLQLIAGWGDERALATTLVLLAILDLAAGAVFRAIPRATQTRIASHASAAPDEPVGRRRGWMWVYLLVIVMPELGMALGGNSIKPFLSLFLEDRYGLSSASTGTAIAIMAGVGGFGALLLPGIAARIGTIPLVSAFRLLGAVVVGCWFTITGMLPLVLLLCAFVIVTDGTEAIYIADVMNRLPARWRTIFSGGFAMIWSVTSMLAATLSGVVQDRQGGDFGLAFAIGAIGYIFSAIWLAVVFPRLPTLVTSPAEEGGSNVIQGEDEYAVVRS
jgi:MFS family permease